MTEPCAHERGDHDYPAAIGSFVAQTRALVAMTAERDAALATLAKVAAIVADPDAALVVDRVRGVLEPTDLPKGTKP